MRASEVIKALTDMKNKHGDMDVYLFDESRAEFCSVKQMMTKLMGANRIIYISRWERDV